MEASMSCRRDVKKEFEKKLVKLYPHLSGDDIRIDGAYEDVLKIEKCDQGSSSFNQSLLKVRDISYVWLVEEFARKLKCL